MAASPTARAGCPTPSPLGSLGSFPRSRASAPSRSRPSTFLRAACSSCRKAEVWQLRLRGRNSRSSRSSVPAKLCPGPPHSSPSAASRTPSSRARRQACSRAISSARSGVTPAVLLCTRSSDTQARSAAVSAPLNWAASRVPAAGSCRSVQGRRWLAALLCRMGRGERSARLRSGNQCCAQSSACTSPCPWEHCCRTRAL